MQVLFLSFGFTILLFLFLSTTIKNYIKNRKKFKNKIIFYLLLSILITYCSISFYLILKYNWLCSPMITVILNIALFLILLFFKLLNKAFRVIMIIIILLLATLIGLFSFSLHNILGREKAGEGIIINNNEKILFLKYNEYMQRIELGNNKRWGIKAYTIHYKKNLSIFGLKTKYILLSAILQDNNNHYQEIPLANIINNIKFWEFLEEHEKSFWVFDSIEQDIALKLIKEGRYDILFDNAGGIVIVSSDK